MGSIFRAIISLIFIVGVSAGLFYWLYVTQFRDMSKKSEFEVSDSDADALFPAKKINDNADIEEDYILRANELLETFRRSKAMLDMEVNFSQEEQTTTDEPLEATAARDKDAQLYIDYEGKLHRISDLQKVNYFMSSLLEISCKLVKIRHVF